MILLREVIGDEIRKTRTDKQKTLRTVSKEASISLGYLSEVERGLKEPSSEILNAICKSLTIPLSDLLQASASEFSRKEIREFDLTSIMN